jgi:hypothetical protein
LLVELLTEWMEHIASQCEAMGCRQDLACWLTERPCYDDHPDTKAVGQFVLEARAFVEAWKRARKRFPALTIRLFLSTTTPQRDDVVIAEAPPDVKILRCCITDHERSINQPRDLFGNPTLDQAAAAGRWLGSYDVPLTCNGRVETPMFKLPHRSAHRIHDFVLQMVGRGYAHLCGMMGWHFGIEKVCGLNIGCVVQSVVQCCTVWTDRHVMASSTQRLSRVLVERERSKSVRVRFCLGSSRGHEQGRGQCLCQVA